MQACNLIALIFGTNERAYKGTKFAVNLMNIQQVMNAYLSVPFVGLKSNKVTAT